MGPQQGLAAFALLQAVGETGDGLKHLGAAQLCHHRQPGGLRGLPVQHAGQFLIGRGGAGTRREGGGGTCAEDRGAAFDGGRRFDHRRPRVNIAFVAGGFC